MTRVGTFVPFFAVPLGALLVFAGCANDSSDLGAFSCPPQCGMGGGSEGGSGSGSGGGSGGGGGSGSSSGGGSEAGAVVDSGVVGGNDGGTTVDSGGGSDDSGSVDLGGDANLGFDAVGSASIVWGQSCLYNFGSSCPFQNPQECGNHRGSW